MKQTPRERRIAFLRQVYERERDASLWGTKHRITPAVVGEPIGDGGQLFWFSAIMTRPNYYVLQVPSTWIPNELPDNAVERMEQAIEDEYGNADEHGDDETPDPDPEPFPAYHDGGCSWGAIPWDQFADEVIESMGVIIK